MAHALYWVHVKQRGNIMVRIETKEGVYEIVEAGTCQSIIEMLMTIKEDHEDMTAEEIAQEVRDIFCLLPE